MTAIPPINGDPETLDLSYGTSMSEDYNVNRIQFGDGVSQRSAPGLNSVTQQWQLTWKGISDDDAEMLRVFFRDLKGVEIIDWTPYNQVDALKWTASGWRAQPSGYLIQDCSITLTQEFDLS